MTRAGLCALLALAACQRSHGAATVEQRPDGEVWLAEAEVSEHNIHVRPVGLEDTGGAVISSGRLAFDDLKVSHVFSPVTGRVTRILANLGERVKKGAPLMEIESPDVGSAFSDLAKAQASLITAEHEFKRQKELFEAHASAQKDFEVAEGNFKKAQAEHERAKKKAQLFRSGTNAVDQTFVLRALIDGEVVARNVSMGNEVQGQYAGGTAVELFTLGELDTVWALADVFETDLAMVQVGAHVTVRVVAYPRQVYEGTVDWVSGSLDAGTRTAKVRCRIKNPRHELKPEMYATISVAVANRPRQLAIPRSALVRVGDQTVVFVELGRTPDGRHRYERRPVAVDEDEGGDFLPVTHGLKAGDSIVIRNAQTLAGLL